MSHAFSEVCKNYYVEEYVCCKHKALDNMCRVCVCVCVCVTHAYAHAHAHAHTHTPDLSSKSGLPSSERINVDICWSPEEMTRLRKYPGCFHTQYLTSLVFIQTYSITCLNTQ